MVRFIILLIGITGMLSSFGQSGKRGMAYGHHSPADLQALSPEISWWYNWSVEPESSVANVFRNYGFEFVPMTWNGNFDENKLRAYLAKHPETKYLLAFNEPNFIDQANMKPSVVAAQWPRLEKIASDFNLKIVAPAVNYCGSCVQENGTTYTDPFKYLDDFFKACPTCKVDYIAVHSYMNTVSALQWYIGQFKKYGKPIWLTEFAGWESNGNINSLNDQINFMIGAVDFLEAESSVFRYSWFIGRGSGINVYPYIDILGADGTLTALGKIYKQMPVHDANKVLAIPATIEAEAYNRMNGILLEKTSDQTGFANVGYIDAGDWLEYKINVPNTDTYDIRFRIASTKSSGLNVLVDGSNKLSQSFNNSNGWQNWITVSNKIELTAGVHTIRLQAVSDGFNINWVQFSGGNSTGISFPEAEIKFNVFPNPGNGIFKIETSENISRLNVFNLNGTILEVFPFTREIDLRKLPAGVYILKAVGTMGNDVATRRILIL